MKKSNGITLIILVVTIVIIGMISGTVIFQAIDKIRYQDLNNLYNDLEMLEDKVSLYYIKNGEMPIKSVYTGPFDFIINDQNFNRDDNEIYYVLNLEAIGGLTLNNYITEEGDDVYIVNEDTHTVYYPKGVVFGGKTYYSLPRN